MNINGKEYKFVDVKITLSATAPSTMELIFNVTETINGQPIYNNHIIIFSGEDAAQKYFGLSVHRKIYELLCNNLGVPLSSIPNDIDSEIPAVRKKSDNLKMVENMYLNFLKNEWTPKLQTLGFIPADREVTIQNTSVNETLMFLMMLKNVDKNEYSYYAGEFDRAKSMIEAEGGTLANVTYHT